MLNANIFAVFLMSGYVSAGEQLKSQLFVLLKKDWSGFSVCN